MYESLHNHTTTSDGIQTYEEVLQSAEAANIGVLAFTDHDALPSPQNLARLQKYDGAVKWLTGIELTSYVPKAEGGPEKGALHILGLFVNPHYRPLVEFCQQAGQARVERMRAILRRLRELGFTLTETDVRRFAPSNNIVLPHIVSAVLSYPENRQLMGQIKEQMSQKAEDDPEVKKAYDLMMKYGPKQYPYALFMTRHAFLPMEVDEVNNLLDADRTVKLIHEAGGIAIMAHWYYNEHKLSEAGLRAMLKRDALDGLESVIINTIGEKDETEEVNRTRKLIEEFGVAETVGSDSHSAADLEAFAQSRYAAESQGQTARLVERFRPDLSWSNL